MESSTKIIIDSYPDTIKSLVFGIRELIFTVASDNQLGDIEETLKWGEPAYLAKHGSTLRVAWKVKSPDELCLFFNCKTLLVETFREIFFDVFTFSGKRAIVLDVSKPLPMVEIEQCILMTLTYHKIKHLPLLGAR